MEVVIRHEQNQWPNGVVLRVGLVGQLRWPGFVFGNWNQEYEGAAIAFDAFTLHPDASTMFFDKSFGQSQSQAGALLLPAVRGIHLLKLLKNPLMVARFDTNARVGNRNPKRLARRGRTGAARILDGHRHTNLPAVRGELDRVAEQVIHDLLEFRLVGQHWGQVLSRTESEVDVFLVGQRFDNRLHL